MNTAIRFNSEDHSYWIGETKLLSVTSLISTLLRPFDSDTMSLKVAKREGVSQAEILATWEAKGERSRKRGERVHSYIEGILRNEHDDLEDALNERLPEMAAFNNAWTALQTKFGAKVEDCECVVGDMVLGIAGRVDVVLELTINGATKRHVVDWKTGKFRKENRFGKLFAPFDTEDECEFVKAGLQISTYRLLLERSSQGEQYGDGYVVHLGDDGKFIVYKVTDYRGQLLQWIPSQRGKQL